VAGDLVAASRPGFPVGLRRPAQHLERPAAIGCRGPYAIAVRVPALGALRRSPGFGWPVQTAVQVRCPPQWCGRARAIIRGTCGLPGMRHAPT